MKTLTFAAVLIFGLVGQAHAQSSAPAPLKPVQILPASGSSKPAKPARTMTTNGNVSQAPTNKNEKQAPTLPAPKPAPAPAPVPAPVQKPKPAKSGTSQAKQTSRSARAATTSTDKLDLARINFNKCVEIEKLSKNRPAVRCMNRILDRMDNEIDTVETRILNCGELRRIENFPNYDRAQRAQDLVRSMMLDLRKTQEANVEMGVAEYRKSGVTVGPRRMKEVEMRAAVEHGVSVKKVANLVCSKEAFDAALDRK